MILRRRYLYHHWRERLLHQHISEDKYQYLTSKADKSAFLNQKRDQEAPIFPVLCEIIVRQCFREEEISITTGGRDLFTNTSIAVFHFTVQYETIECKQNRQRRSAMIYCQSRLL